MPTQIIRFTPSQTAKLFAVVYAVLGLILAPIFYLVSQLGPKDERIGVGIAVLFPIMYAVFGYIFVNIGCRLYNFIAARVGGIEVETRDVDTFVAQ